MLGEVCSCRGLCERAGGFCDFLNIQFLLNGKKSYISILWTEILHMTHWISLVIMIRIAFFGWHFGGCELSFAFQCASLRHLWCVCGLSTIEMEKTVRERGEGSDCMGREQVPQWSYHAAFLAQLVHFSSMLPHLFLFSFPAVKYAPLEVYR